MTARKAPAAFSVLPMPADADTLPLPSSGPYYVVAKDKILIHKITEMGRTLTPIKEIAHLPEFPHGGQFWSAIEDNQIPVELLGKAWHFFRTVWEKYHTEAMVDITRDDTHGYRLFIPPQKADGAAVQCQRKPEHYAPGTRHIGTIHSHCDFGAGHSGTDTHDASEHDGIHFTIGNVNATTPSIAIMYSVAGARWPVTIEEATGTPLSGLTLVESPTWWINQVSKGIPFTPKTEPKKWQPKDNQKPPQRPMGFDWQDNRSGREIVTTHKRGNGRYHGPLAFNQVTLSKTEHGRSMEEIAFSKRDLTAAQKTRFEDAMDYMDKIDTLLASLGLQIDYGVIQAATLNDTYLDRQLQMLYADWGIED